MAFFGLTALGAQNSLAASLPSSLLLDTFTDAELQRAFNSVTDGQTLQSQEELKEVMEALYRGPAPPQEVDLLIELLPFDEADEGKADDTTTGSTKAVTFAVFLEAVAEVQVVAKACCSDQKDRTGEACEFTKYSDLREHMRRHRRVKHGPTEKFTTPVIASQEHGWHPDQGNMNGPRRGKLSCPETIYQAELIKAGVLL